MLYLLMLAWGQLIEDSMDLHRIITELAGIRNLIVGGHPQIAADAIVLLQQQLLRENAGQPGETVADIAGYPEEHIPCTYCGYKHDYIPEDGKCYRCEGLMR